jgi:hypothetical protein
VTADFGFAYLTGGSFGVLNNGNISFAALSNTPPGSLLSLDGNGNILINDTGFYQVSWGVSMANTALFQLRVNSVSGVLQQTINNNAVTTLVGQTVVVRITSPGQTLSIFNVTGSPVNIGFSVNSVAAYMTVIKLSNLR